MSASMYWRPAVQVPEGEWVPDRLRHILAQKLWGQDGSMTAYAPVDAALLPYLEGLADAQVEGAPELIEAIRKHGAIEVEIRR